MNNNKKFKLISLSVTTLIVICGLFAMWFTYKTVISDTSKEAEKTTNVEINKNVFEKVTSPEKFGSEISPNEEGYGRANPFTPYK
jgi:hypothetical protein